MNSFTSPPTLVTVPTEILEAILPYLSQNDLCHCALVSQEWSRTLTPYLWKTIATRSRKKADRFCRNESQQALKSNATLVRELHLIHKSMYELFLPSLKVIFSEPGVGEHKMYTTGPLTSLHTLELHSLRHPRDSLDGRILALVRQNPSIKRLQLGIRMDANMVMQIVTRYLPNLEELDLYPLWRGNLKELLENLPEGIRTVKLRDIRHIAPQPSTTVSGEDTTNPVGKAVRPHRSLETLQINGYLNECEEEVLIEFLESCSSKLKSISGMGSTWQIGTPAIFQALSKIGFVWTELSPKDMARFDSDTNVAGLIANNSWTVIEMYLQNLGSASVQALVENCNNLTVLNIMEGGNSAFTGVHMQTILSKARNLKMLQAHWLLEANKICAADIFMSEWATTSLEHIDFKIDVPRVYDEDITEDDNQAVAIQESRNTQRRVLRRLGQQRQMKKLIVGGMATTPSTGVFGHQRNCLEFTLEAGLYELKDLKNLELLDIHHMDHRVGVLDLEWMKENWPQVNTVVGMRDSLHPSEQRNNWLTINRPSWG
ncbi:hypothetical protein EMPS_09166 [Entomortierella parvispora]|uniref:F-box domain-containing protein n=1 Tax=Entomortierella parvispora TaxID=205924 RepID=A0A9P3M049_9FUNG|nr:hypothetical protein EMPS_09166 [Entomortierella parvispora]